MKKFLFYAYLILILTFWQNEYASKSLAHKSRHNSEGIITNNQPHDGFGSQFQTIIASVIYAELNDYQYAYTPFQMMEHNYTNESGFMAKKEWLINFIDNFESINKIDDNKNLIVNADISYKAFFDKNVEKCANSHSLKMIKRIFRENKNINNYFNNENLNIAVHVRRPNQHDIRAEGPDTPDHVYLAIVNQLRVIYASKNPLFHLYSQGSSENFKAFDADDIVLHLNESVEDTFLAMVLANVLVASASSFSYVAGLLSDGVIYYIPFWHAPLPSWTSIKDLLHN